MQRVLPITQLARQIGTHIELVFTNRALVVHVVEGRDFVHRNGRHTQVVGNKLFALGADVT